MYTLYYLPDACSLATHVVLNELRQKVELIDVQQLADFAAINPVGAVPVIIDNGHVHREGAAIMLHLLDRHDNTLMPSTGAARQQAIQDILFANATMHPAYGRLFFIDRHVTDEAAKQSAFDAAAQAITDLWPIIEQQLATQPFLGGDQPSAADIMLTVYSRWAAGFPVTIALGAQTQKMVDAIQAMPSFQRAIAAERCQSAA